MLLKTATTSLHYAIPVGSEMTNHAQQWLWGNAGERRSWALKFLASVPRPHTAVKGTSRLRGAPSAYNRALRFFRVAGSPSLYFDH